MIKINSSFLLLLVIVTSFFPEHNAFCGDFLSRMTATQNSAPRKKATAKPTKGASYQLGTTPQTQITVETLFARSTSYCHDESGSDEYTSDFGSKTQVPLVYLDDSKIGIVAVAGNGKVKYGDLIITPDGRRFLAADTGEDVKTKKASAELVDALKGKRPELDSPRYREAEVLDFFMPDNKQVCSYWDTFIVVRCPEDFMSLTVKERAEYLNPAKWEVALKEVNKKYGVQVALN
jgi:hypothetical protein